VELKTAKLTPNFFILPPNSSNSHICEVAKVFLPVSNIAFSELLIFLGR